MSRGKDGKGTSKVSVSEAASRVGCELQTTPSQGRTEAWSGARNPHGESGTRWRAATDVGATGTAAGAAHGQQKRRDGNRLGDSVGAQAPCTSEGLRSAERMQQGAIGRRGPDSGDVLPRRMSQLRRFKG